MNPEDSILRSISPCTGQTARASSESSADARPGMVTFWPDSSSAVAPSASRPGSCRCARCCRRRNWSSGPRTARPTATGDFRDVIRTFSPSPPQPPQPHPPSRRQPRPHPYRRPSCQPHSTMVGKVSERVLAREGKHPLSIRRDGPPHAGSPWTGTARPLADTTQASSEPTMA